MATQLMSAFCPQCEGKSETGVCITHQNSDCSHFPAFTNIQAVLNLEPSAAKSCNENNNFSNVAFSFLDSNHNSDGKRFSDCGKVSSSSTHDQPSKQCQNTLEETGDPGIVVQSQVDVVGTDIVCVPTNHLSHSPCQNVSSVNDVKAVLCCAEDHFQGMSFQCCAALSRDQQGDKTSPTSLQARGDRFSGHPVDQPLVTCSQEDQVGKADVRCFSFLPDEAQEMMVMVSSLTPVLQRRRAVHRSHSHPGAVTSGSYTPIHNGLDVPIGRHDERLLQENRKELQDASQWAVFPHNKKNLPEPAQEHFVAHESSGDGIFITPAYAGTWHGQKPRGGKQPTPKMGVGMVPSSSAPLFHGNGGSCRTGASPNPHTLPHISRTILDALHKRYYGYQYAQAGNISTLNSRGEVVCVRNVLASGMKTTVKKLNSDGESDASSSAPDSTHSSPRTFHHFRSDTSVDSTDAMSKNTQVKSKDNQEAEIEAVEACQWLRAAGFPQYAQMFEDGMFPIDISDVKRDHDFLDGDSIQSLFRRLGVLNSCAVMKIDTQRRKHPNDESDEEEDLCALSDRWEYQKNVRRWSRKGVSSEPGEVILHPTISHDSLLADQESGSHGDDSPLVDSKMPCASLPPEPVQYVPVPSVQLEVSLDPEAKVQTLCTSHTFPISPKLRRSASERLKSALKKMDSFKKKPRRPALHLSPVEISGPVVTDQESMQAKLQHLKCMDLSLSDASPSSRLASPVGKSTPISSRDIKESAPLLSPVPPNVARSPASSTDGTCCSPSKSESSLSEYYAAHSQLLAIFQQHGRVHENAAHRDNGDNNLLEIFLLPQDHKPGSFPRLLHNGYIDTNASPTAVEHPLMNSKQLVGAGELGPASAAGLHRFSMYDNIPQHSQTLKSFHHRKDQTGSSSETSARRSLVRSLSANSSAYQAQEKSDPLKVDDQVCFLRASTTAAEKRGTACAAPLSECDGQSTGVQANRNTLSEFDTILQGLYKEISDLDRVIAGEGCGSNFYDRDVGLSDQQKDGQKDRSKITDCSFTGDDTSVAAETDGCVISSQTAASLDLTHDSSLAESQILMEISHLLQESRSLGEMSVKEGLSLSHTPDDDEASNSNSSHDASEGEDADFAADASPSDSQEKIDKQALERRDSGVGSSLTRNYSERKHKKLRWHSFQKSHRPSITTRDLQIWGLSVCQLLPLRQLSLLRLTAIMEKCSPSSRSQWSWSVPRFMKRNKSRQFDGKNVFGVPLMVMQQRSGQPLPQCVLYAMRYLRRTAHTAVGIFRKSGVRSRIQKLRDMVEAEPDSLNFDELQPYDIADLLKQYFRELPECLLTNKLSETFRSIFTYVPESNRLEALQNAVILLPEENQEVLYCLLLFLSDIAHQADTHQMTASNLAVCFAPSLFNFVGSLTNSPRRQRKNPGIPEQYELLEQKAVHECFTFMITNCKKLFMVPSTTYSRLRMSTQYNMEPVHLDEFYATPQQPGPDFRSFGEEHIQVLLKEVHDKNRGWLPANINVTGIEVMYRKPQDSHPLKQWKCSVEIEAPPIEVLNRILHERHTWDDDLLSWSVLDRLDRHADVFQYVLNCMAPHPPRIFTVIRYWRPDLAKEACAVVSRSVEHAGSPICRHHEMGVRAVELGTYFLMEPCGSGRSRLTYIARVDLRGRCPEWYNRVYGHLCALLVERLRDSFRQEADGPETKV